MGAIDNERLRVKHNRIAGLMVFCRMAVLAHG